MKPTLYLLSGTLCDERFWQHQLEHLGDLATLTVPDLTQHDDITALARDLLNEAPESFSVAGFSMGGIIAQELLKQAPERIEKLALIGTSTGKLEARKRSLFQTWHNATQHDFEQTLNTLPNWIHPENKAAAPLVTQMGQEMGLEVFRRQGGILLSQRNDNPEVAKNFTKPTLIIHGEDDPASAVQGNIDMAKLFPKARRIKLPNCGHYTSLEKPDAVTALLAYWLQEDAE